MSHGVFLDRSFSSASARFDASASKAAASKESVSSTSVVFPASTVIDCSVTAPVIGKRAFTVTFPGGAFAVIAQCLGGWEHHQVVKLSGTEGSLWASWSGAMDRTTEPTFTLRHQRGDALEVVPVPKMAGEVFELADQFARFVHAIQTGGRPAADGEDGRWSVLLCEKARESILQGSPALL